MAAPPNLSVAFAFGVNPGTVPTSGQWVDVTAYVDSLSTSSGRDDEFSEPGAGTCTLVMSNATGRFDPVYASGPYYGQLKPMVPVRVMGGVSSADTAVFYGWVSIDGFRVSPRPPADSVVEVTVVDAVELLAHADLSGYLLNYERGLDSPAHLWRFDGSAQDSIVANNPATLHPEASFTGPSLVDSAPGPALAMPWDIYDPSTLEVEFFGAVAPAGASGTAFTVELMFQSDPSTRSGQPTVEVLRMTGTTGSYVQVLLGGEFDPASACPSASTSLGPGAATRPRRRPTATATRTTSLSQGTARPSRCTSTASCSTRRSLPAWSWTASSTLLTPSTTRRPQAILSLPCSTCRT